MKLERIPHIYHDTKYVRKIFEIISTKYVVIKKMYKMIENFYDLNKLEGFALDLKGQNISVYRDGRTDEEYRKILFFEYLIFAKIRNVDDLINMLKLYFGTDVKIEENNGNIILFIEVDNKKELYEKLRDVKAAGVGIIIKNETTYRTIINNSYANFAADSLEFIQDVRKFREIKNETNYSYFIPYNENVEFEQSTLKFKEFKAITNYNYITTTHENIEYIQ
ncbi:MAG: hypothetical protein ACRCTZ_12795 [Sarcina sp.]